MENMKNTKKLNEEAMENVNGGYAKPDVSPKRCHHPNKYKTGAEREEIHWLFFKQRQCEYCCPDCQRTFWVDED